MSTCSWPSGAAIKNVSEKEAISIYMSHVSAATLLQLTVPLNHKTILPSYVSKHTRTETYIHAEKDVFEHVTSYCCI